MKNFTKTQSKVLAAFKSLGPKTTIAAVARKVKLHQSWVGEVVRQLKKLKAIKK